jgi:hypothetical protein
LHAALSPEYFGKGVTEERPNTPGTNGRARYQIVDRNSRSDTDDQSGQLNHAAATEATLHDLSGDECQMILPREHSALASYLSKTCDTLILDHYGARSEIRQVTCLYRINVPAFLPPNPGERPAATVCPRKLA